MSDTPSLPPPPPPSDWDDSEEHLPELPEFLPPPEIGDAATGAAAEAPESQMSEASEPAAENSIVSVPPPAPADDECPEHSTPFIPPPSPDDEVSELPPLPPQESTERSKGTGISVALGIAAFFTAAMGFQNQSDNVQLKSEIEELNSRIGQQTSQQEKYAAELRDMENCEQQINEANAGLKQQQEEYNSLSAEISLLQRYSRPRVLARDKGQLQDSIAVLQRQSAELDGLLEMYLPPAELSEDKLQERDIYIRKFAFLYNIAWHFSAWNLMSSIYADEVKHQLTGNHPTNVRHVIEALRTSKIMPPGALYAIGYNGLSIELIFKDKYENSKRWYKEKLFLNEQGRIFRWSEEVVDGEQPSLSAEFRNVTVSLQEKQ